MLRVIYFLMRSFNFLYWFLFVFLLLVSDLSVAVDVPQPGGSVNDLAGMIDSSSKASIVQLIDDIKQKTTVEIAVLTVETLGGVPKEDFAIAVAEKWGVGKKGADNGLLILIAKQEREYRVEIGRGLEGVLNDAKVGRIARQVLVPDFKRGQFGRGIFGLILEIKGLIENNPEVVARYNQQDYARDGFELSFFEFWYVLLTFGLVIFCFSDKKIKWFWVGGWNFVALLVSVFFGSLVFVLVIGVLSLLFGLFSRLRGLPLAGGLSNRGRGGLGGGFGSGGSGGFGGGSFGGGGAGGRW